MVWNDDWKRYNDGQSLAIGIPIRFPANSDRTQVEERRRGRPRTTVLYEKCCSDQSP